MTAPRRAPLIFLLAVALFLPACADDGWGRASEPSQSDAFRRDLSGGMVAPRRLIVHPLSRITVESAARPARAGTPAEPSPVRMILHLELRDEFNQSVKSLGRFRIHIDARGDRPAPPDPTDPNAPTSTPTPDEAIIAELHPVPVRQPGAPDGSRQFTWALDLTDPRANARFYDDLVTRTYTIALAGLPAWVQEWARSPSGSSQPPLVRVTFEFMETPPTSQPRPTAQPTASADPASPPVPAQYPAQPVRVRTLRAESRVGR